ncbi:MAG: M43 family zinc metalloprotease [Bacteroidia bacterium]
MIKKIKVILTLLGSVLAGINGFTQTIPTCLSDELRQKQLVINPAQQLLNEQMEQQILQRMQTADLQNTIASVYSIPVVVHIIHNNGPENISNAQVFTAIQQLNDAFANTGAYQDANGVNTGITFCLAQQDENGNFTNGINRVVSPLTDLTAETDDVALKNLTRWDPTKYLNIWVVNSITSLSAGPGVSGYAFLPASHGLPEDGIVNEANYFGSGVDQSKVFVHEVGHYLGLYHTFEGGCQNNNCLLDGDRVCDTPPDQSTAAISCSSSVNTCSTDDDDLSVNNPFRPVSVGGIGDQNDQVENYMDYGYQVCQHQFTNDQKTRMIAALTTSRASLLQSIGCQSLCTNPIAIGFTMNASTITAGGTVNFTNTTTGAATYQWLVGSIPLATTSNASYLFSTPGYYVITLHATNGDISCDESMSQTVIVECGAQASFSVSPAAPYSIGATLNFTSTSANATSYQWVLDGVNQSTASNYGNTFNNAGGHYIYLVASNGTCSDTSVSHFFEIGNCNLSISTSNWILPSTALFFSGNNPPVSTPDTTVSYGDGTECTSSWSDANGNLLLYTDGVHAWNHNHQMMPNGNGLGGGASANQSCLVTPDPGNPNRYYIFTEDVTYLSNPRGLQYSIVDMTLDNGLGDIIPTAKNVPVINGVGEQLTGTFHANGQDIWITVISISGNTVYNFLLTSAGLNTTPVVNNWSAWGIGNGGGAIKYSHDGNRFAANITRNFQDDGIRIADFDASTGLLSNMFEVTANTSGQGGLYGMEFSPDNSKLYFADFVTYIYQLDLSAGSPAAITASLTNVDAYNTTSFHTFGHLELALDGKIYIAYNSLHLDCIPNPNLAGTACGYISDAVYVQFAINIVGPNFLRGVYQSKSSLLTGPDTVCAGSVNTFSMIFGSASDSVLWKYQGNGTLSAMTATSCMLTSGSITGIDTLTTINYGTCGVRFDTLLIQTVAPPFPSLGPDTFLCESTLLSPGVFQSYQWQNNSAASTFTATVPGIYWVNVTAVNGCIARDSIMLSAPVNLPPVNLGNDITVCLGNIVTLQPTNSFPYYTWQDGSHNSTFTAYQPGLYWLTANDGCVVTTDSVRVIGDESAIPLDLGNDTGVCLTGFPITLTAPAGYSYLWQDGSALMSLNAIAIGTYWVNVTNMNGCMARDTIEISLCTAVNESASFTFSVYPNPAGAELIIDPGKSNDNAVAELFDPSGRKILVLSSTGSELIRVNTSTLSDGIYLLCITKGEQISRERIIIQH